jgi:hypothetical protein
VTTAAGTGIGLKDFTAVGRALHHALQKSIGLVGLFSQPRQDKIANRVAVERPCVGCTLRGAAKEFDSLAPAYARDRIDNRR